MALIYPEKKLKIALLSNFTIDPLPKFLEKECKINGIDSETYVAPYNQYTQEILDDSSDLYKFSPKLIFILLDLENLLGDLYYLPLLSKELESNKAIKERLEEVKELLITLQSRTDAKIVMNAFIPPLYSAKGILENKDEGGLKRIVEKFNFELEDLSAKNNQLFVFNFNAFFIREGYEKAVDKRFQYIADMKISTPSLKSLSKEYLSYIFPLASRTKKCIVLDLDNTLWGGIVGEVGLAEIKLGPEKEGRPFLDFQKRILELYKQGIILAINSKNNLNDALEVLEKHEYMILKKEHFACIKINWEDKATNMRQIADELDLGLDSLVFFDDDPASRELIRKLIPEIMIVELPKDPVDYPKTIENLKVFNRFSSTIEDKKRGEMYMDQKKRKKLETSSKDLEEFLKQLDIRFSIGNCSGLEIPRISQLTGKTNQFNLTTKRYSEEEISKLIKLEGWILKFMKVEDKFGDYGLTGVSIIKEVETWWEIDSFLLSCRILGKKLEFSFMENLVKEAKENGIKEIFAKFIKTEKNVPAQNFLKEFGFKLDKVDGGTSHYHLKL